MLGKRFAVYINQLFANLNMISGQTDDSLHVICLEWDVIRALVIKGIVRVTGIFEDDYVPAPDLALRQKRQLRTGTKYEFIYQQVITDRNRVLHRAGWNFDRLHDESHAE